MKAGGLDGCENFFRIQLGWIESHGCGFAFVTDFLGNHSFQAGQGLVHFGNAARTLETFHRNLELFGLHGVAGLLDCSQDLFAIDPGGIESDGSFLGFCASGMFGDSFQSGNRLFKVCAGNFAIQTSDLQGDRLHLGFVASSGRLGRLVASSSRLGRFVARFVTGLVFLSSERQRQSGGEGEDQEGTNEFVHRVSVILFGFLTIHPAKQPESVVE